jgi:hypothetical protein
MIRQALGGKVLRSMEEPFEVEHSWHHSHVQALWEAMRQLGMERLLG